MLEAILGEFSVEVGKLSGRLGMLCRRIPPFPKNSKRKTILRLGKRHAFTQVSSFSLPKR